MAVMDFLAALSNAPRVVGQFEQTREARADRALSQARLLSEEARQQAEEKRRAEAEARTVLLEQLQRRPRNESGELVLDPTEATDYVRVLGKGAVRKRPDGSVVVNPTVAEENAALALARGKREDEFAAIQDPVRRKELALKARGLERYERAEARVRAKYGEDWMPQVQKLSLNERAKLGIELGQDLLTEAEKALVSPSVVAAGMSAASARYNAQLDYTLGMRKAELDAAVKRGEMTQKQVDDVIQLARNIATADMSTADEALPKALAQLSTIRGAVGAPALPGATAPASGGFRIVGVR